MIVIDTRIPPLPAVPTVSSAPPGSRIDISRRPPHPRVQGEPRARHISDLDFLTDSDRDLIHAVTGEHIWPGQSPQDRPVSAFAMQIAVDRRTGVLPLDQDVTPAYLHRTSAALTALNVPANPFTGELLERAMAFLASRIQGRIDVRL